MPTWINVHRPRDSHTFRWSAEHYTYTLLPVYYTRAHSSCISSVFYSKLPWLVSFCFCFSSSRCIHTSWHLTNVIFLVESRYVLKLTRASSFFLSFQPVSYARACAVLPVCHFVIIRVTYRAIGFLLPCRIKRAASDQRIAELQALIALSNGGRNSIGHGQFDPYAAYVLHLDVVRAWIDFVVLQ